jgi:beta-N-acetylhexosaminidase
MRDILISLLTLFISISVIGQEKQDYNLQDFYSENMALTMKTDEIHARLTEEQRVAQMLIASLGKLGKPYSAVKPLIEKKQIGGVIFLSGDPEDFRSQINEIDDMHKDWPMIMSMDAEPSLLNRRMPGTPEMKPTAELLTEQDISLAVEVIDNILDYVGFHQNFAPVVDLSASNVAIGNRTFGLTQDEVAPKAAQFINETQKDQIVATAKHFPGHGRVAGDTHKKLVYIDGELTELGLYPPMIEAGVLSIMVGHIAVENNDKYSTDGAPATLSSTIVNDLLRDELGFKGIIITDAMNMGAVAEIPESCLLAAKAGCDMILMPPDEIGTLNSILSATQNDPEFAMQIEASVKRIIRLKICLGMEF